MDTETIGLMKVEIIIAFLATKNHSSLILTGGFQTLERHTYA